MPYDERMTRLVTPKQMQRLQRAAETRPRVAFAGEFSAGKSTLLNLLLGESVLPARATATALPPVWLAFGTGPGHYVAKTGQVVPLQAAALDQVPSDARYIRLWREADLLRHCDLIDLPGISDPQRSDGDSHAMVKQAHMVIWCTPATQAWRQSEASTWLSLPDRLHAHSIMAITRADQLERVEDHARVLRRLSRETARLFAARVMVSSAMATAALRAGDDDLESESGYPDLVEALLTGLHKLKDARQSQLSRYASMEHLVTFAAPAPAAEQDLQAKGNDLSLQHKALGISKRLDRLTAETAQVEAFFASHHQADQPPLTLFTDDPAPDLPPNRVMLPAPTADEAPLLARLAHMLDLWPEPASEGADRLTLPAQAEALPPAPQVERQASGEVAQSVRLWRDLVASDPTSGQNAAMIALLDRFLVALSQASPAAD